MAKKSFFGRGKLLLTGEYAVVNGAKALAIPTSQGQRLTISTGRGSDIKWKSKDADGSVWFDAKISLFDFTPVKASNQKIAERLGAILESAVRLNSDFLSTWKGVKAETQLEFPREWGWGSSSSLIYCIAQWAEVDPYDLYARTFGGSGYDIACAGSDSAVLFQKISNELVDLRAVDLDEQVSQHLHFVYSGQKAQSADALSYIADHKMSSEWLDEISSLSQELSEASSIESWLEGISKHNELLAPYLGVDSPALGFPDFSGAVKYLGAWGGDFLLAASAESPNYVKNYFTKKGFAHILSYDQVAVHMQPEKSR
ncbi:MAG: GHMP kinase [Bacteroidetes bacterium]|jgi:mevalonate kinase|nr:GHMP kinase [Bacteroidota bacterium]